MAKFSAFFSEKNAHLLKILLYNPIFFLFPKFLEHPVETVVEESMMSYVEKVSNCNKLSTALSSSLSCLLCEKPEDKDIPYVLFC